MMRMNARSLVSALILIVGGLAAENRSLKIHVAEDELFWARKLQDSSMSVTPPPTLPPTLPATPPPTVVPDWCLVGVSSRNTIICRRLCILL
jgi:hypothetical protein